MSVALGSGLPNPFTSSVATGSWTLPPGGVPDLFQGVFDHLNNTLQSVLADRTPRAVLVCGEAGAGKTHLISQYRAQVLAQPDRFLVSVQLETTPGRFWRFVRKQFAADLLRKKWDPTRPELTGLLRILANRFPDWVAVKPAVGGLLGGWGKKADEDLREHLAEFSNSCTQFHPALRTVLPQLWREKSAQAARDWLAGGPQTSEQLKTLGVPVGTDGEGDAEEEARDVVVSLCRLASEECPLGQPTALVVCFDQIEGLSDSLSDTQALQTFAKAVNSLLNCPGPRMIPTFLRESFFRQHQGRMDPAYRDRLIQNRGAIPLLTYEQAIQVIAHRIQASPEWRAAKLAANGDQFWPFGEAAVRGLAEAYGHDLTPRLVLRQSAVWVQELQKGKRLAVPSKSGGDVPAPVGSPPATVKGQTPQTTQDLPFEPADDIPKLWAKQRDKFQRSPAAVKFDTVAGIGLPWLRDLLGLPLEKTAEVPKHLTFVDLLFAHPNAQRQPLGVSVCSQPGMALTNRLKKLTKEWEVAKKSHALSGLVVVRPQGDPVGAVARQTLDALAKAEARVLLPPPDLTAELAAYQQLFTSAVKGDVTRAGKPIDAGEYNEWAKAHLTPAVRKFAADLFGLEPRLTK